ncbi:MAG: DegT/DnrJ/EryC1/StrS aminotransferase family protein [Anaerolineae bacterium]
MPDKRSAAVASRHLLRQRTRRAHAVLAGRGAAALQAALTVLDVRSRPVLIPANSCYIVLWAVLQRGCQPVLVDVDPLTANVTPETLARCGVTQPAVIIPAHMYGLPAPMSAITAWARARGAFVIEDAALALGTLADGKPAGAWGDASIFSFGQGKTADIGFGGALLTDDARLATEIERALADMPLWSKALQALNRQWLEIYWALHQFEDENNRLAEVYPALFDVYRQITRCRAADWRALAPALDRLDENLAHRHALAEFYDEQFAGLPVRSLSRPEDTSLWRYPLLVPTEQRNELLERLWETGIFEATRWYPSLQPMLRALAPGSPATPTPATDALAKQIVNLPLAPETTREHAREILRVIVEYFEAL